VNYFSILLNCKEENAGYMEDGNLSQAEFGAQFCVADQPSGNLGAYDQSLASSIVYLSGQGIS
jgi:hypothetical protein